MLGAGRRLLCHGAPARLLATGAALTIAVAALAALAGAAVEAVAVRAGAAEPLVLGAALWLLLALRGLVAAAEAVARPLAAGDLAAARHALGRHLVSRPTAELDAPHVASGAVESVAENLTDGYVAPVLLFLVLGLPGAAPYRAINTADAMLGYRDGPLEYFGKTAARLDDVLNLVPARLAALAIVAAAPLAAAGASARQGWVTLRRDRARTASPNAGWTMAAMAGALGVTLEKPGAYRLGSGGRAPCAADVTRSVRVVAAAAVLVTAALLLAEIGVRAALVPAR